MDVGNLLEAVDHVLLASEDLELIISKEDKSSFNYVDFQKSLIDLRLSAAIVRDVI